jgi:hypothetical protein
MLTAQLPPAVFKIHQAPDTLPTTIIAATIYLGVFVIIITAGLCILGNRLPRFGDFWKRQDDDDQGEEVTHVIPASPLFVPARQVRR